MTDNVIEFGPKKTEEIKVQIEDVEPFSEYRLRLIDGRAIEVDGALTVTPLFTAIVHPETEEIEYLVMNTQLVDVEKLVSDEYTDAEEIM